MVVLVMTVDSESWLMWLVSDSMESENWGSRMAMMELVTTSALTGMTMGSLVDSEMLMVGAASGWYPVPGGPLVSWGEGEAFLRSLPMLDELLPVVEVLRFSP